MKLREAIERMKNTHDLDEEIACDIWTVSDVFSCAIKREIYVSVSEAERVLRRMQKGHDANVGFNWDIIELYINDEPVEKLSICQRCGTFLDKQGMCKDITCPFHCHQQHCGKGWVGHPERKARAEEDCSCIPNYKQNQASIFDILDERKKIYAYVLSESEKYEDEPDSTDLDFFKREASEILKDMEGKKK